MDQRSCRCLLWPLLATWCLALGADSLAAGAAAAPSQEPRVIATIQDFEKARPGKLSVYRQLEGSELAVIAAPDPDVLDGKQSLRFRIAATGKPADRPVYQIGFIDRIYLPPEADSIRAKVRVKSGRFSLTLGGPTVYFGNSDVTLEPQTVAADGKTYLVEWSLHHRSSRNFRRLNAALNYGRDMSFIHYPRWVQEPIRLYLVRPPAGDPGGELIIDSIEIISRGEGRPFPVFADADCIERGAIDFQDDIRSAFTFSLATGRDVRMPAKLSHVTTPAGGKALRVEARFTEETSVAGIRVDAPPADQANALAINLLATHPKRSPVVVDLLLVVAAKGATLPAGAAGFDHDLANPAMAGKDYATYHARRVVEPDRPGILVPFADFACFYGQGTLKPALTDNLPVDPARIVAVGILVPYGFNSDVSTLTISRVRWLTVPGTADSLRSYRQPTGKVTISRTEQGVYGGVVRQEEEGVPPPVAPIPVP